MTQNMIMSMIKNCKRLVTLQCLQKPYLSLVGGTNMIYTKGTFEILGVGV